jgi:Rrf2 family protein
VFLSRKCVYGLRAVIYVARNDIDKYVSIREISENLNISFHFLTKILQILTQDKLMVSYRGPSGGINLAKSSKDITILDVIHSLDGETIFQECILGLPNCGDANPCPLHDNWFHYCNSLKETFSRTTIHDLIVRIKESNLRISDDL